VQSKNESCPVDTPEPPAGLTEGLYTAQQSDGQVRFVLATGGKAIAHVTLSPEHAGEIAANALGGAYDAYESAAKGLIPTTQRQSNVAPYVRITGLGVGACPIEDCVCLAVKIGATEIGFAVPKAKLKEFAQAIAVSDILDK
jgi:hypothetical protein